MGAWKQKANKSTGEGGNFAKPPAGNHSAVLVAIIDMGEQHSEFGGESKWQHRAYFVWELVGEQIAGTKKNHVIGIDLTVSLNEKAKLRKWIEARAGKPIPDGVEYEIDKELGQPCLLNVVMKGDYPKVEGVAALPKGMPVPKPSYPLTLISLDEFSDGKAVPEWVPWLYGEALEDHIRRSKELGGKGEGKPKGESKSIAKDEPSPIGADGTVPEGDPIPW